MIATIRVLDNGNSRYLCDLDLLKFSEEQVRERMRERDISDDAFFVCGFKDWHIDRILSLEEAYRIKSYVEQLYDGDDYVIRHMLQRVKSMEQIFSNYYKFVSKDELVTMQALIKEVDTNLLLETFYRAGSWVNFVMMFVQEGYLLNTPNGYYLRAGSV